MSCLAKRRRRVVLLGVAATLAVVAVSLFRFMVMNSGSRVPVEPFRIAGNLYYVGGSNVSAFLLTGSDGHVLIDGGYPRSAPMILESIATLGFDITDVRVLLNSYTHFDHRFQDGTTIRVGPLELTAHFPAGHTTGCTSWSFQVRDGDRELRAVSICSLTLHRGVSLVEPETYPGNPGGLRAQLPHVAEPARRSLPRLARGLVQHAT